MERETIRKRLLNSLKNVAKLMNIKILYIEEIKDKILGYIRENNLGNKEIIILLSELPNPYILAHELGHCFCKKEESNMERMATDYGFILIRSILNEEEFLFIQDEINPIFGRIPAKETK